MQNIEPLKEERLKAVISVYDHIVLHHNVNNGKLSSGRPLTLNSLKKVFSFIEKDGDFNKFEFEGFIPKNVLNFRDDGYIIFYTEPQRKRLLFSESLKMKNEIINIPYLLWVYKDNSLSVFSLKKKPVSPDCKIFQAPFLNINYKGDVCMGSARYKIDGKSYEEFMIYLVDQFFNSVFTHTNEDKLATINIREAYELAKNEKFNWSNYLVPSSSNSTQKIKDIL